jgi:uncharacterized protein (TIGR02569 family)
VSAATDQGVEYDPNATFLVTDGDDPPMHVRSAFGVRDVPVAPLHTTAMPAWRCGEVLIRPVRDTALASWSSGVLDTLAADGLRIARPLRGSDGRWVVCGFSACQYIAGSAEPRYHDMVAASLRLHAATASVRRPRLLDDRDDLIARADAAAWGERAIRLAPDTGGALFSRLAERRQQLRLASQVVHGDLFGTLLFDGDQPPGLLDLVPFWRPVEWAAAVIVIDALAWGGASEDLVDQWAHLEAWPQSLLRALLFRLALHAQHPGATTESLRGLEYAADVVVRRV